MINDLVDLLFHYYLCYLCLFYIYLFDIKGINSSADKLLSMFDENVHCLKEML